MQEEDVVPADVMADLPGGLEERQRLDVTDRAADLGDDDVDVGALATRTALAHCENPILDLVRDVRNHLHGVAQIVAAPLLGDDRRIHLSRGDVGAAVRGRSSRNRS